MGRETNRELFFRTSIFRVWEASPMLDVLFIVVTIGFFAITLAYTAACERL
jgi:hypothetical protein